MLEAVAGAAKEDSFTFRADSSLLAGIGWSRSAPRLCKGLLTRHRPSGAT